MNELQPHKQRPFCDEDGHGEVEDLGCAGCFVGLFFGAAIFGVFLAWIVQ